MMAARTEKRQPATNVFDNLHSLNMVFSAIEAVRTGHKITIDVEGFPLRE